MRVKRPHSRGAALPIALVTLMLLATMAHQASTAGLHDAKVVQQAYAAARNRWLIAAAEARAIAALTTRGDLMTAALHSGTDVPWSFGGASLLIRVEEETSKLDVNAGDKAAVSALLGLASKRSAVQDQAGRIFTSPEQAVPLSDRFEEQADAIKRVFTSLTGQATPVRNEDDDGGDPQTEADSYLSSLRRDGNGVPRSIFRIVVSSDPAAGSAEGNGRAGAGRVEGDLYILIDPNDMRRYHVIK